MLGGFLRKLRKRRAMRNKHRFKHNITCKCPHADCGRFFGKVITVVYVTNQKGDVIEHKVY